MTTFHEIFWWFGVTLFTVSAILFYGLLSYVLFKGLTDKPTK